MPKRRSTLAATLLAIAAAGMLSWTVVAQGEEVARMIGAGLHGHGSGGHDHALDRLTEELDLRPDQRRRLEKIQDLAARRHGGEADGMGRLHEELMTSFLRDGSLDATELKRRVDEHVETMRATAHALTDEIAALVNGLDADQQAILRRHIEAAREKGRGHGH